jgi:HsdM N-terminal domain
MAQTVANLIWKIADLLRGPYQPNQYGDVILPFTIQRRPTPGPPTPSKHPSVAGRTAGTGGRRLSNRLTSTAGVRHHQTGPAVRRARRPHGRHGGITEQEHSQSNGGRQHGATNWFLRTAGRANTEAHK